MKRLLMLVAACFTLAVAQDPIFGPEDRDDDEIALKITTDIGSIRAALTLFTKDDKAFLKEVNATLEMERTKLELEAYIKTDSTSKLVIMGKLLTMANTFIAENLLKMTIRLASDGGYFSILTKSKREDLTDDLNALKKDLDLFMVHYNKVKNAFDCKLAKRCYAEDLDTVEGQFYDMWNAVESLKLQCRTFDIDCIQKFMEYKTMFETFEKMELPPLKLSLKAICDMKCYATDDERFRYEKSLLTLDISASGMVAAVQFAVKHAIVKRLNSITKKMHIRKESLNIYKLSVEDATNKDALALALVNLKTLAFAADDDIYKFNEVFGLIITLEAKLSKEDFDHIKRQANKMIYRLSGMMKQINECIDKVENIHAFIAFKIEVNDNEATLKTNCDHLELRVRRVKQGRHALCRELDVSTVTLLQQFKALGDLFTKSDVEFKHLHARLSKDFKDSDEFDTLKASIAKFEADNIAKMKEAGKYEFFLHVYDKTYCPGP